MTSTQSLVLHSNNGLSAPINSTVDSQRKKTLPIIGLSNVKRKIVRIVRIAPIKKKLIISLRRTCFALFVCAACSAQAVTLTEFSSMLNDSYNDDIVMGAEGNIWVLDGEPVLRVTPAGEVAHMWGAPSDRPHALAAGPDGNIWFVNNVDFDEDPRAIDIYRLTKGGAATRFRYKSEEDGTWGFDIHAMTAGPDGNVWAVGAACWMECWYMGTILKITPDGAITVIKKDVPPPYEAPLPDVTHYYDAIAAGPDGNLWIVDRGFLIRVTTGGAITELGDYGVVSITAGFDGNMWAIGLGASNQYSILRISPNGGVTSFDLAGSASDITLGGDGNIWFGSDSGLGRITPNGKISYFNLLADGSGSIGEISQVTSGSGKEVWFRDKTNKTIGHTNGIVDPKNNGKNDDPNSCTGNPILIGSGNKFQIETDYVAAGASPLEFRRTYNSNAVGPGGMFGTNNWLSSYDRAVTLSLINGMYTASVQRPDGKILTFNLTAGVFSSTGDIVDSLTPLLDSAGQITGYTFVSAKTGDIESYDKSGRLQKIKSRSGIVQTLGYEGSKLASVTDSFGRSLSWTYGVQNRVETMTDPSGKVYRYAYDIHGNLSSITYPDNAKRQYLYEDNNFQHGLTGLIDENNARFATWSYDAEGRAISSEHATGVEKVQLTYGFNSAEVTDAIGSVYNHQFEVIQGAIKRKRTLQPGGSGCNAAPAELAYDGNGNVASRSDFNGNTTTSVYDLSRNLETKRIEASGTEKERTVTTEWHPTYRLPTKIYEPKRITTNTYDAGGNLLSKSVQATTDATGAYNASLTNIGTPRTWRYTYNGFGQLLTATGPRTNIVDKTTYEYDAQGNLVKITNAAGHVTTLSNYDANGRVGRMTDPNGLITDLAYSPRGWLTSMTVGSETVIYEYDGIGQLLKAIAPDGSYLSYTYDDAHRLTNIVDNTGNRIDYTLDVMGNRIKEEIKDQTGILTRQITRTYDALNRLQQITGGLQ
jgi:YD repeat-containing protein